MRILYIHGFGSSPQSRKAKFFEAKLSEAGHTLIVPDLVPVFERITLTEQLQVIDEQVDGQDAILIGSSLGGYLSAIYANNRPNVRRVLLLAPAFRFQELWHRRLMADQIETWKRTNQLPVFHYSAGREVPMGFQLMTDAAKYPAEPGFSQPGLIIHGRHDDTVPIQFSVEYVALHKNVELFQIESGHELTDVLDAIWVLSRDFLLPTETHI